MRRFLHRHIRRDQSGASLVLAIAFMVVAGAIGSSLLPQINSSAKDRGVLDTARNRQYDAEDAIDMSVAHLRGLANPGAGSCADQWTGPNGNAIFVTCTSQPTVGSTGSGSLALQNVVVFTACIGTSSCTNPIITAQINYVISGAQVKTIVQAWSVNG